MTRKTKVEVPLQQEQTGGGSFLSSINEQIVFLNSSKFFAGVIMILVNIGSKFISIQFSKSTEQYLKMSICKEILVFAMAWLGTRDIYTALGLTAVFIILSDHLFNEESQLCIVPKHMRVLDKVLDTNNDGEVSEAEITSAISTLEKARREKNKKEQQNAFMKFNFEKSEYENESNE
jgi:hypothetical protein